MQNFFSNCTVAAVTLVQFFDVIDPMRNPVVSCSLRNLAIAVKTHYELVLTLVMLARPPPKGITGDNWEGVSDTHKIIFCINRMKERPCPNRACNQLAIKQ